MSTNSNRVLAFPSSGAPRVQAAPHTGDEALLGPSAAVAKVWAQIRRVAPHFRAAVITGEPGCGAEAVARALHVLSPISRLPLLVLDPKNAEDALRGSGSATLPCDQGLIFLEDLDRLSPEAQRGLLRKLRMRGRPLRVVAATSTDLRASVSAGRFSSELAEALAAIRIALPPLRERGDDIALLAGHFMHRSAAKLGAFPPMLDDSFLQAAAAFPWPGNLQQLESTFDHLLKTGVEGRLTAEHLGSAIAATAPLPQEEVLLPRMVPLDNIVQEHIRAVLVACHGNKLRAAEVLGISRSTLYRMLDCYNANQPVSLAG